MIQTQGKVVTSSPDISPRAVLGACGESEIHDLSRALQQKDAGTTKSKSKIIQIFGKDFFIQCLRLKTTRFCLQLMSEKRKIKPILSFDWLVKML